MSGRPSIRIDSSRRAGYGWGEPNEMRVYDTPRRPQAHHNTDRSCVKCHHKLSRAEYPALFCPACLCRPLEHPA